MDSDSSTRVERQPVAFASRYFAFESKYKAASKRVMTTATTLELSASGCALDGAKFSAPTFVAALEAFNQVA